MPISSCRIWITGVACLALIVSAACRPESFPHTYYISQAGSATLAASTSRAPANVAAFNMSRNWSRTPGTSGKISPGDTVKIEGTITSFLTFRGGGTSGHLITLLFDAGALMTNPTWGPMSPINVNHSFVVVDGGASGTIGGYGAKGSPNGIIQCTSNGDGLTTADNCYAISINNCNNVTVQGLLIRNMYVPNHMDAQSAGGGVGIGDPSNTSGLMHDITVRNCIFHDMQTGVIFGYGPATTNCTVSFVTAYNCNWGGAAEDGGPRDTLSGLVVHDCYFHDWQLWDSTAGVYNHHNGFYAYAQSGGVISSATFYNIFVGPNWSGTKGGDNSTSGIFLSGPGMTGTYLIYNIIGISNPTGDSGPSNDFIFVWPGNGSTTNIFNCSFPSAMGEATVGYSGNYLTANANVNYANIISANATAINVEWNTNVTVTSDFNDQFNLIDGQNFSYSTNATGAFQTLAQWKANSFSPEAHSVTTAPNLNSAYAPTARSGATGAGTDKSAFFTADFYGNPRKTWDIGAVNSDVNPTSVSTPSSTPTPVSAGVSNASKLLLGGGG
jgi:hypothetical protein